MQSFFAMITLLDKPPWAGIPGGPPGPVDPGYGIPVPPGWEGGPPRPTHPIAPGGGGWWGQANDPGYSPPWARPQPPVAGWPGGLPGGGGFPGQGGPVDPGYSPPWARPQPPYPDNTLPGMQPHPSHPIYFPPEGGQPPLGIWGPTDPRPSNPISGIPGLPGSPGQQPHPEHPIVLPPNLPPVIPPDGGQPERKIEWKTAWTPQTGWIVVGIPAEGTLVPTPSGQQPGQQQPQQPAQPKK